jgi:16S rRNA (guanine527-N7)-methyltransferase
MKDGASRPDGLEGAVFAFLASGLRELPLTATDQQIQQLVELVELLVHWASRINLTGHRDPLSIAGHLVLDAAALSASLPELAAARSLADLGTGAGFPGLPLAILNPHLQVQLVDARQKRNHFQREARRRLGLSNVEPRLGRVEEIEVAPADVVVAQAMAQPERALTLMAPWASEGGLLILPASESATAPAPPAGWCPPELRVYVVPRTGTSRRIWVMRRSAPL